MEATVAAYRTYNETLVNDSFKIWHWTFVRYTSSGAQLAASVASRINIEEEMHGPSPSLVSGPGPRARTTFPLQFWSWRPR